MVYEQVYRGYNSDIKIEKPKEIFDLNKQSFGEKEIINMNHNVALYTRVSTADQAKEGYSLEVQREDLESFAKQ